MNANTQHNFLALHKAELIIPEFNGMDYAVTQFTVPGISLPETRQPTRRTTIKQYGTRIDFEPLVLTFSVAEDLSNYLEIQKWIYGLGDPEILGRKNVIPYKFKDIRLITYTNSEKIGSTFTFRNAHPVNLGGLDFDVKQADYVVMQCTAQFTFDQWEHRAGA